MNGHFNWVQKHVFIAFNFSIGSFYMSHNPCHKIHLLFIRYDLYTINIHTYRLFLLFKGKLKKGIGVLTMIPMWVLVHPFELSHKFPLLGFFHPIISCTLEHLFQDNNIQPNIKLVPL